MRRTRPIARHLAALAAVAVAAAVLFVPASAAPTWLGAITLSAQGNNAADPQVATDAAGNVTAVWAHGDGANFRVQVSRHSPGAEWSVPETISPSGVDAIRPQVVVDAAGTATVVWQQAGASTDEIRATSRPLGGTWSPPETLASAAQDDVSFPELAIDGTGNVTVAYNIMSSAYRRIAARTRPPGGGWGPPELLSATGENARDHTIAGHPGGAGFTVAWMRPDAGVGRIQERSRSADGTWSAAATISAAGQDAETPHVAVHPDGDVTAVWSRYDGASWRVQARTRRGGGTWVLSPVTNLSEPGQDAAQPRVGVAPDGTITAVWARYDGTTSRIQSATRPPGGSWSVVPDTLSEAGQTAREPRVVLDGAGNTTAIWERTDGSDYRIQTSRRPPNGAWSSPATLSAAGRPARDPRIAVDGAGDVVAMWGRSDGIAYRIQTTTLDVAGPVVTALAVPAAATAGQPVAMSVSAHDTWSPIAGVTWSFGDGSTATGTSPTHAFTAVGSRTVTVTVTDAVGNATTRQAIVTVTPAAVVPRITAFKLKPGTIRVNGPRKKTRTKVTLALDTDAKVRLVFKKKGAKKKRVVWTKAATLTKTLEAGTNTFRLTTKVGRKRLGPGTYRVTATATNTSGTSRPVTVRLRVVR